MSKRLVTVLALLVFTPMLIAAEGNKYNPESFVKKAAQTITPDELKGHIQFLASDLLEGRGPATKGDQLTQEYIASQFQSYGLKPGGKKESWYQPFTMVRTKSNLPDKVSFNGKNGTLSVEMNKDFMAANGEAKKKSSWDNVQLVFVGYGIQAPEYNWNDYKDIDVTNKVLVFLNNDPSDDPKIFEGKTRLYYGRWSYKNEMAGLKKAAGAMIIHTIPSAGYPWQVVETSWSGDQFSIPSKDKKRSAIESWITYDAAKKVFELAGEDLASLEKMAQKRDFKPVQLDARVSLSFTNEVERVQTANVVGILEGSDKKKRKEFVVYTAHHDHLGKSEGHGDKSEDKIFNGALDNASGVSTMLSLARAFSCLEKRPSRSIMFLAVGAEESGLLGSQYFAQNPLVQPGRIAANINIDGVNRLGKTSDITQIGRGKSTLDEIIDGIASMQDRVVKNDAFPDRGYFYRSDQFNFAKIGVPAAYFHNGLDVIGKPKGWGEKQNNAWVQKHYHQPSDEFDPSWDFSGAIDDARLYFYLGYEVANSKNMPNWNKGDEFEQARIRALKQAN